MKAYHLLPFTFSRVAGREVLVNEAGDIEICPEGTVASLLDHRLDTAGDLYKSLVANFFVSEDRIPALIDVYAERLAEKKRFLDEGAALHIFVLTLRCNQNCVYCQALSQEETCRGKSMTPEALRAAVRLMFRSRSQELTMEFQGGEPTLEEGLLREGVEYAERLNAVEGRELRFVLCTNSVRLSDELLAFCRQHGVLISTSLDGPAWLHNQNRGKSDSHEKVTRGIARAREALGEDSVSALMTTSELALDHPREIIDEYVRLRFPTIFIRALNPYGLAAENHDWSRYTERFIEFYKQALDYIIELNQRGVPMVEAYAAIILRKMLTPTCTGFVDLQSPAGIVNSVLVYDYDGYVYASDESRMLAEQGDYTFRLGSVADDYDALMHSSRVEQWASQWNNETLAGCADCGVRQFCGADPVRNHSTQGDAYGCRPTSMVCRKNGAIIEHLLWLMIERREEVMPLFTKWVRG